MVDLSSPSLRWHYESHSDRDHHVSPFCDPACRLGRRAHAHRIDAPQGMDVYREVRSILSGPRYALLSAENPRGTILDPAVNAQRTETLRADLGGRAIPVEGSYVYTEGPHTGETSIERSWLVPAHDREGARRLAKAFDQESFVYANELLRSDDGSTIIRFDPKHAIYGPRALRENPHSVALLRGQRVPFALKE